MTGWKHAAAVFAETRDALGWGPDARRAALARLRRLRPLADAPDRLDPTPILGVSEAVIALRRLGLNANEGADALGMPIERAIAALSVVAEIRTKTSVHPASALRRADFKEDRFIRLLRMDTPAERLNAGRRLVRVLEGAADPGRLGADLLLWSPATRVRWAFHYHEGNADAVPDAVSEQNEIGEIA